MPSSYDLFCYGTLCFPEIMFSVIGRVPNSVEARVPGFTCYELHGASYPAMIPDQQGSVNGLLYTGLGIRELGCIDKYEGKQYLREQVAVMYGEGKTQTAWSYLLTPGQYHRLKKQPWCRRKFAKNELDKYIIRHGWRSRGLYSNRIQGND